MTELPAYIKQYGYIATRRGDSYIVEYMVGGHDPNEEGRVELTIEEMETIYNNPDKWDEVIVQAENRSRGQPT
jgi:hypothetical protein